MKILTFLTSLTVFISCNNSQGTEKSAPSPATTESGATFQPGTLVDSNAWHQEFLRLKQAISTGNKTAIKSFINFPIVSAGNEIWLVADLRLVMEMDQKNLKPFTEDDFDKYFSSIIPPELRKTMEKINPEELFTKHQAGSPELTFSQGSTSKLNVDLIPAPKKLHLRLLTSLDAAKYTVTYQFEITEEQKIILRQVQLTES